MIILFFGENVQFSTTANILLFFRSGVHSQNGKKGLRRVIISRRHLDAVF